MLLQALMHIMCKTCVRKQYPQRGRLCSESGAYLANFVGCTNCQGNINVDNESSATLPLREFGKQVIEINEEESNEDDPLNKEMTRFEHVCRLCNHLVAKHTHEFWVEDGYQEYRMECPLCGLGQDTISVMPKDPRKVSSQV